MVLGISLCRRTNNANINSRSTDFFRRSYLWRDSYLCIKITAYPLCKKYSAEMDPLDPALKLSTNRTVLCSKGVVVPPLCNGNAQR